MENRRNFIRNTVKLSLGIVATSALKPLSVFAEKDIPNAPLLFTQVALPYSYTALEPSIDALTMEIHYTKHHTSYVKNVNDAIKAENLNFKNELDFFSHASSLSAKARNNGGGAWNHNFFWKSMQVPNTISVPSGKLKGAIDKTFDSFDQFKEQFSQAALARFGSGWVWLVNDKNTLKITSTPNQDNPLMDNVEIQGIPLLGLDVWEHAYYLKYQHMRNDYINQWWNVVNWAEVEKRFINKKN